MECPRNIFVKNKTGWNTQKSLWIQVTRPKIPEMLAALKDSPEWIKKTTHHKLTAADSASCARKL